jgi:hypothetical protein
MTEAFSLETRDASEFPLMVVTSIVYPCNFGCPNCPYTDDNSDLRVFYRMNGGDRLPVELWDKIADECATYGSYIRCTGGGEPMLHPELPEMIASAKAKGAKIWLNTNGSMFGPDALGRNRLLKLITAKVDVIEFSMDAADPYTYNILRPPISGKDPRSIEERWNDQLSNIREALTLRDIYSSFEDTKIVVSMIRQKALGDLGTAESFWRENVGVDNVITRKFLSWDSNTTISLENSMDNIYETTADPSQISPCVWLFERLNIDTLGRFALCGQDISFTTAGVFPTLYDTTIKEVWHSDTFNKYRALHLGGNAGSIEPCSNCSAWKAGVRDWNYGWLNVIKNSTPTRTVTPS